ncbi:hypothetical protein KMM349_08420 [Stenotrophomonas maltophilia]|nr:hypothetical protein KMM349_08420 [Stenotrophomonas maltophilia]
MKMRRVVMSLLHKSTWNQSIAEESAMTEAEEHVSVLGFGNVNGDADNVRLRGPKKTTAPKGRGRGASTARMDQKRWVYFM